MLYERWRQVVAERRGELALREAVSGRQWTFDELRAAEEDQSPEQAEPVCLWGNTPEFIFSLLAAWRAGKIVCPLEPGQMSFRIRPPPSPCIHLKMTSATGGEARLVAFTARQLAADAENIVATMGLRPEWPNLGVISMAHSYGFSNLVLPLVLHGIPLILAPSALPEAVRSVSGPEPALTLPAVPALWRAWHEAGAVSSNVRLAISAGAPLPARLEEEVFQKSGIKIHNFYGSTECGGIAYDASEQPRTDEGCVGAPLRNAKVGVNDGGCLTVHSPAVGETYWPEPAAGLGAGRFQTGDLAELRGDLVFLRGRVGDLINIAGRKTAPEVIERELAAHPRVRDCLVLAAPSRAAERTDIIVAIVAGEAAEPELKAFLQERLPAWQVPREWRFVETLEANGRGKVSRAEWRRRFLQGSENG
jgi:acyl-CoA synthetase (AMP-forming)/AMP-acid ligase II